MRILTLVGLLLAWAYPALADDEFINYVIGDRTALTVWVYDNGPGPTYFAPHDNENTSVAVAMEQVGAHGGRVIQLAHNGERNISFDHGGKTYVFDPNRMFTDKGAEASLKTNGPYSQEALNMVRAIAKDVASVIEESLSGKPIVAIHNNTNGSYSVENYKPGGSMAKEASKVFVNPTLDPDDFFFVTTPELYVPLRGSKYNVVLQNNKGMTDDGSLSVYAAQKGIPYVNVEAEEGHTAEQAAMLKFIAEMLR